MTHELIPIRLSHLLGQSGVGAIVRGPSGLVVVHDTRDWTDRNGEPGGRLIPYVERIRAALGGLPQLREPPVAREGPGGQADGVCVPVSRFPGWARCTNPKCGALHRRPWFAQASDQPDCQNCKKTGRRYSLEQVTWVLVHPAGYLDDVPWHHLAHQGKRCEHEDALSLLEKGPLLELRCSGCGAQTGFRGDERALFGTRRMQPWRQSERVPRDRDANVAANEEELAHVLPITDARVYEPVAVVAMVIPPESRVRKGTVVDRLYRNSADRKRIDMARTPLARRGSIRELATRHRCTVGDIEEALKDLDGGYPLYGERFTPGQLRESEYDAFLETLLDRQVDEDLVTRDLTIAWREQACIAGAATDVRRRVAGIGHLVRVDRLKAVRVFKGFRRPVGQTDNPPVPPDIVGKSDWLPAVELYGEGLFITLDEARLSRWEKNSAVIERLAAMNRRFVQAGSKNRESFSPRFVLLHTLSHLLMRGIESEGGYPAASLTEVIYCASSPKPMAGMLIYVAVPDIAGSLGGLAELAEPRRFLGILTRALEHATWCSLDPVCSKHEGQGPWLLNRSACHACALVPDTACAHRNTLLDRGVVKGDPDAGLPAFFEMP